MNGNELRELLGDEEFEEIKKEGRRIFALEHCIDECLYSRTRTIAAMVAGKKIEYDCYEPPPLKNFIPINDEQAFRIKMLEEKGTLL